MAALPPVPKCVQFQLIYSDGSDTDVRNMLYFTYTQTMSETDLVTLCKNMKTQWGAHLGANTSTNVALEEVFANDLSSPTANQAVDGGAASIGSGPTSHLSSGAAFVMSQLSPLKYRGGHSRVYLPGQSTNNLVDANTWSGTWQTTMINAWNAFITSFISTAVPTAVGVLAPVVAHRFGKSATAPVSGSGSSTRSVPLANPFTSPITAYRTNPQVGSQRRRNQQAG